MTATPVPPSTRSGDTPAGSSLSPASLTLITNQVRALLAQAERLRSRVLLLRALPEWSGPTELTVGGSPVRVATAESPLAVWQAVTAHEGDGPGFLVVLTSCTEHDLGTSLLAKVVKYRVLRADRWDLVREAFGAAGVDSRLTALPWAAEALLAAQPGTGWPKVAGAVLDRDTALRRLTAARLGLPSDELDPARLLEWSTDPTSVARYQALGDAERAGITVWLTEVAGPAARALFRIVNHGRGSAAVPFGLVAAALWHESTGPEAAVARVRAEAWVGREHGGPDEMLAFGVATEGLVQRWADAAGTDSIARGRVASVLDQADRIVTELEAGHLAGRSSVLRASFLQRARATALAAADAANAGTLAALAPAEHALKLLTEHILCDLETGYSEPARMAVRLARWLVSSPDGGEPLPTSVAHGINRHVAVHAWVDRALHAVWTGDPSAARDVAQAYQSLNQMARERRAAIDRAFAQRLAAWTEAGSAPDKMLQIEDVLRQIAVPFGHDPAPLVLVLDGMSGTVACELAEELAASGWTEVGRSGSRESAIAAIPSVTGVCRASLLSGRLTTGGQNTERDGFAVLFGGNGLVFHKGDLDSTAGRRVGEALTEALQDDSLAVAVVLNTIDDTLDHGREGEGLHWRVDDVRHLGLVLERAQGAGRPVILVADHGHVLDRRDGELRTFPGVSSARWRPATSGPVGEGEIQLTGERVLEGDGSIVAPWSEGLRYSSQKAGYHGGAALAEMSVPILVLVRQGWEDRKPLPAGFQRVDPRGVVPTWWDVTPLRGMFDGRGETSPAEAASIEAAATAATGRRTTPRTGTRPTPQAEALFALDASTEETVQPHRPAAASLGAGVVASEQFRVQKASVRRVDEGRITALVDALSQAAGGQLSLAEVAEAIDMQPMRVGSFLAQASRLLNVDAYAVLETIDQGRTAKLNKALLLAQFGLEDAGGGA